MGSAVNTVVDVVSDVQTILDKPIINLGKPDTETNETQTIGNGTLTNISETSTNASETSISDNGMEINENETQLTQMGTTCKYENRRPLPPDRRGPPLSSFNSYHNFTL